MRAFLGAAIRVPSEGLQRAWEKADQAMYAEKNNGRRTRGAIQNQPGAADHLRWLAVSNDIESRRIGEVLDLVGLGDDAGRPVGAFSLGMQQRLGLATALLGDPETVIFDEPINGLDPEGILWLRRFLRDLADEGRTVFLSSHLMGEMALTADHLVVIGQGRLIVDAPTVEVVQTHARSLVRVRAVSRQDESR